MRFLATAAGVALALLFTGILATSAYLFGRHMGSGKEAMLYSVLGAGAELHQDGAAAVGCLYFEEMS